MLIHGICKRHKPEQGQQVRTPLHLERHAFGSVLSDWTGAGSFPFPFRLALVGCPTQLSLSPSSLEIIGVNTGETHFCFLARFGRSSTEARLFSLRFEVVGCVPEAALETAGVNTGETLFSFLARFGRSSAEGRLFPLRSEADGCVPETEAPSSLTERSWKRTAAALGSETVVVEITDTQSPQQVVNLMTLTSFFIRTRGRFGDGSGDSLCFRRNAGERVLGG